MGVDPAPSRLLRGLLRGMSRGMPRLRLFVLLPGLIVTGCAGGIYHSVHPGENLYRIGLAYGVHYEELADENDIPEPYRIMPGQEIYIPGASETRLVDPAPASTVEASAPGDGATAPPGSVRRPPGRYRPGARRGAPASPAREGAAPPGREAVTPPQAGNHAFVWPIPGVVTSGFGPRGRSHHDGIDIGGQTGDPVHASRGGTVVFSDRLRGYGKVIIVEHDDGFSTVYAHHSENIAQRGERVRQGQTIARVGETGRATRPHLHFEIRVHDVARNPRKYLPRR